jgi:hypothetical protein
MAEPEKIGVTLLDFIIAILGLALLCCLLFGFVSLVNAHSAFNLVRGQPYHSTTFQVIRPYYQRSAGMHGPDIAVYASGRVEGQKEWINLVPVLKRVPRDQAELDSWVAPGCVIPVYLFPGLRGQNRVQVIDVLPPGEASRRTEIWVLRRAPVAIAVLGTLIFLLVRLRRSWLDQRPGAVLSNAYGLDGQRPD